MDQTLTNEKKNNLLPGILIVAFIVVGVIAYSLSTKKQETAIMPKSTEETSVSPTINAMKASSYKNGSYSAIGDYVSPGGSEQIGVKITLKDGIIVDAEVESKAERPKSVQFQGIFVANFKTFVIGKNIDEVKLDKVSGSSLTPKGFNDAVEKIKTEAKS